LYKVLKSHPSFILFPFWRAQDSTWLLAFICAVPAPLLACLSAIYMHFVRRFSHAILLRASPHSRCFALRYLGRSRIGGELES
jgi:hypothetical protein